MQLLIKLMSRQTDKQNVSEVRIRKQHADWEMAVGGSAAISIGKQKESISR